MLVAFVYYFAGYRLVSYLLTMQAKYEAASVIHEDSSLKTITLSASDFNSLQWTEEGKEFSYEGQLYDMSSLVKTDNGYMLKVYYDKKESHLTQAGSDFIKILFPSDNNKESKDGEGLLSLFQKEYLSVDKLQLNSPAGYRISNYSHTFFITGHNFGSGVWHPPANC